VLASRAESTPRSSWTAELRRPGARGAESALDAGRRAARAPHRLALRCRGGSNSGRAYNSNLLPVAQSPPAGHATAAGLSTKRIPVRAAQSSTGGGPPFGRGGRGGTRKANRNQGAAETEETAIRLQMGSVCRCSHYPNGSARRHRAADDAAIGE
jgi:hypothetical protein